MRGIATREKARLAPARRPELVKPRVWARRILERRGVSDCCWEKVKILRNG